MEIKTTDAIIHENFMSEFFSNGEVIQENLYLIKSGNETSLRTHGKGPINIALVKYWGKKDEKAIIPLNNSISVTLDMDKFYTDTYVELKLDDKSENKLFLNGKEDPIGKRVTGIIDFLRANCEGISTVNY